MLSAVWVRKDSDVVTSLGKSIHGCFKHWWLTLPLGNGGFYWISDSVTNVQSSVTLTSIIAKDAARKKWSSCIQGWQDNLFDISVPCINLKDFFCKIRTFSINRKQYIDAIICIFDFFLNNALFLPSISPRLVFPVISWIQ